MTSRRYFLSLSLLLLIAGPFALQVFTQAFNQRPISNAGRDQTATVGAVVRLDGSASSDEDGNRLQFQWSIVSRPDGSSAVLSSPRGVTSSFVPDVRGVYIVQLTVQDGIVASEPDTVTVSTTNTAPVADAGPDQTVAAGSPVSLNGSASTDADGDSLTYAWSFVSRPAGSAASLNDATAVLPSFTADRRGTYVVQLIVRDSNGYSVPDTMTVTTQNSIPVAIAGPGQSAAVGALVLLDGSESADADGDALTFTWSITSLPAGSNAAIAGSLIPRPSFVVDQPGTYVAQLIVSDGLTTSTPSTVTVSTMNLPPLANAGADQLDVPVGDEVRLLGDFSRDPDGKPLTYAWTIIARPEGSSAMFRAVDVVRPVFTPDVAGDYVVQLIVHDGVVPSTPDTLLIRAIDDTADDNERARVGVAATDAAAAETGSDPGTFTFTRRRAGRRPLVVNYSVSGTASNGTDYTPTLTGSVTIAASQLSATVTITPVDDADIEGDETVVVTVGTNAAYTVDAQAAATLTIADNDGPIVTVAASDPAASETGPDPGTWTFTRTGPTTAPLVVSYSTTGTATSGTDYAPVLTGTVTIPAGQSSTDVTVTPVRDNVVESPETVVLTVQPGPGYSAGSPNSDTVTIADDPAVVSMTLLDTEASEAGSEPGVLAFTRSGGNLAGALTVNFTINGSATAGVDYSAITGSITILANEVSASQNIVPLADNVVEPAETVMLTISASTAYKIGDTANGTVTIADDPVAVTVTATDSTASETGPDTGLFTFARSGGDVSSSLQVFFSRSGSAAEGSDYANLGAGFVTIPSNQSSATLTVTPMTDADVETDETVVVTIDPNASYAISGSASATVTIHDSASAPLVSVVAVDSGASESGLDVGVFRFTRSGGTTSALTVNYMIGGTAGNGTDYGSVDASIVIPLGQTSADLTITPILDGAPEPTELVEITVIDSALYDVGSPASATVTIADAQGNACGPEGGTMVNGAIHCGTIFNAGEIDTWTFNATAGDRIAIHIGEVLDNNAFTPWIRLQNPNGVLLSNTWNTDAAAIDVAASVSGTYTLLVASADSGFDGTGTYRLTMTHTPGPITVSDGDQGGPLINGAIQTGEIVQGDVDVWIFTATAGDRIAVHAGEITDSDNFVPWIRLWGPNGAVLGNTWSTDAAAIDVAAGVSGTYLLLVASADSGYDGTGTYRLTMTHTPGPITVSDGDQGGPLINGAIQTGEIVQGDVDVWTFTATAGDRIAVHAGEITDSDNFVPWIRLWGPNGAVLGNTWSTDAAAIDVAAGVSGTYLLLVASADSGYDGTGTYRLTMTHTPGPITVSDGDQGGPLINGAIQTGEIVQGDVDVWTFTATAGDRIAVHAGEITDSDNFVPWIRLWGPNGAVLGNTWSTDAAVIDVAAGVSGTYLLLVASADSGYDGTGTYRLTMTHTPGPITVSPDDQGGPLVNGATHTGEIVQGDVDIWTFTAAAGDRIAVNVGEITDTDNFVPWIRLWGPNGAVHGNTWSTDAAAIDVVASVSGTYLLLVASADSGYDGTGTYQLTMAHTPGPISVSPGDQGGSLTNGAAHTGEIVQGDLDVWTFNAVAGEDVTVQINETSETDNFVPWIRLWGPNGAVLGNTWSTTSATIHTTTTVSGTYLVLVGSADAGYDGTGTYQLTVTHN